MHQECRIIHTDLKPENMLLSLPYKDLEKIIEKTLLKKKDLTGLRLMEFKKRFRLGEYSCFIETKKLSKKMRKKLNRKQKKLEEKINQEQQRIIKLEEEEEEILIDFGYNLKLKKSQKKKFKFERSLSEMGLSNDNSIETDRNGKKLKKSESHDSKFLLKISSKLYSFRRASK